MTRADRGIEYYDDTTNQVLLGGLGGNPEDLGIKVKHPHFLPRIGFAYRMGENNVIRGGYGITVSPLPFSRPLRGFYPLTIIQRFVGPNDYRAVREASRTGIPALLRARRELGRGGPARQRPTWARPTRTTSTAATSSPGT